MVLDVNGIAKLTIDLLTNNLQLFTVQILYIYYNYSKNNKKLSQQQGAANMSNLKPHELTETEILIRMMMNA